MVLPALVHDVLPLLADLTAAASPDDVPEPEDVKAGWTALIMFLIGCVVVGLLGWNLYARLRRTEARRDAAEEAERAEQEENDTDGPGAAG